MGKYINKKITSYVQNDLTMLSSWLNSNNIYNVEQESLSIIIKYELTY